jgi:hypothetical protein
LLNRTIPTQSCPAGKRVGRRLIQSSAGYQSILEHWGRNLPSDSSDLNLTFRYRLPADTAPYCRIQYSPLECV